MLRSKRTKGISETRAQMMSVTEDDLLQLVDMMYVYAMSTPIDENFHPDKIDDHIMAMGISIIQARVNAEKLSRFEVAQAVAMASLMFMSAWEGKDKLDEFLRKEINASKA